MTLAIEILITFNALYALIIWPDPFWEFAMCITGLLMLGLIRYELIKIKEQSNDEG